MFLIKNLNKIPIVSLGGGLMGNFFLVVLSKAFLIMFASLTFADDTLVQVSIGGVEKKVPEGFDLCDSPDSYFEYKEFGATVYEKGAACVVGTNICHSLLVTNENLICRLGTKRTTISSANLFSSFDEKRFAELGLDGIECPSGKFKIYGNIVNLSGFRQGAMCVQRLRSSQFITEPFSNGADEVSCHTVTLNAEGMVCKVGARETIVPYKSKLNGLVKSKLASDRAVLECTTDRGIVFAGNYSLKSSKTHESVFYKDYVSQIDSKNLQGGEVGSVTSYYYDSNRNMYKRTRGKTNEAVEGLTLGSKYDLYKTCCSDDSCKREIMTSPGPQETGKAVPREALR